MSLIVIKRVSFSFSLKIVGVGILLIVIIGSGVVEGTEHIILVQGHSTRFDINVAFSAR